MSEPRRRPRTPFGAGVDDIRRIKKYPNRRLYDTQTSSYVTLAELKQLVAAASPFVVEDAKTGQDLTRSILLQILLEEEAGGIPMFSEQALAQLIRFQGHALQGALGQYLERNMQTFVEMQSRLSEQGLAFTPEAWAQFLNQQAPLMQDWVNNYVERSRSAYSQMQEQLHKQTEQLFEVWGLKR